MLKRLLAKPNQDNDINETIESIQAGNEQAENELIHQYLPFIRKVTSGVCKRYINPSSDDEFSIAMIAFSEAIHKYSSNKGSSFLSFANLVIRRRVIDYIRMEQRKKTSLSLDYKDENKENMENVAEISASFQDYHLEIEREHRREEILHFQERLSTFEIRLSEVASQCPKHCDARLNMVEIARTILEHDHLLQILMTKKRLPVKQLMEYITMSRKTIERNRKYIIALVIVMLEDYQYLKDYLREWLE
ncbi:RNA polymerase sigma-I factor [Salipaludibacillus keqinensis]|uniref:RNA polymerase sigma factor SigI n=1 Tax=Salipaludibacillus keqinensis TaxID=2045207 RepID=A0A323TI92_9BACI|nr:RNA polymerase sigma-I factor [Salipaludibacillus keqinensis]PYZ94568.1 RNA polymerase sigma-I factor [Salipaludibacillus keqinensis]